MHSEDQEEHKSLKTEFIEDYGEIKSDPEPFRAKHEDTKEPLDLIEDNEESKELNEAEKKHHVKTEDESLSCSLRTKGKKSHQKIHTGEKHYECSHCEMRFSQSGQLKAHERIHTGEKTYACDQCGKSFKQATTLKLHLRSHSGERPPDSLSDYPQDHSQEKPHMCTFCGKSFSRLDSFRMHQRRHSGVKNYMCFWENCGKTFIRDSDLKRHQRSHTGEKPYQCSHCDKRFNWPFQQKKHERIHTDQNKCDQCEKSFADAETLKLHLHSHFGERPLNCYQFSNDIKEKPQICFLCGKSFTQQGASKIHQESDSGVRNQMCLDCGNTFITAYTLADFTLAQKIPFFTPI
ncbi:uncharacterized protein [Garra rufa]|uniref:uncharacterized protein n=1 Tax=Garra rufa TaxID=137080 RepID=UPI003CCE7E7A